jgi:hypothetical protein
MRRWTIRIIAGLVLLFLAAMAAVQIVLWTDLPRQWILHALIARSGLVVTAESISVAWTGHTTVRDVIIKSPISDEDLLSAETISLSHRSIFGLALWRSLGLTSIRIVQPQLYLRRTADRRWNVRDMAAGLSMDANGDGFDPATIPLPRINVEGALVHVVEANGVDQTIGPMMFQGLRQGRLSWDFALIGDPISTGSAEPWIEIRGTLVRDKELAQVAAFRIEPNDSWITAVLGRAVGSVEINGRWQGHLQRSGLTGTVHLDRLETEQAVLSGTARVTQLPEGLKVDPENLLLETKALQGKPIQLSDGTLTVKGGSIEVEGLRSRFAGLTGQMSGHWSLTTQEGDLTASWAASLPGGGQHNGTCQVTVESPPLGRKEARLSATLAGQTALGAWRIVTQTQASGATWEQSRWRTSLQECTMTWKDEQMKLDGTAAEIALNWPIIHLAYLAIPNASHVEAEAEYDASKRNWFVRCDARDVRLSKEQPDPLTLRVNADGNDLQAAVSELRITEGRNTFTAAGRLSLPSREIRGAHLQAQWREPSRTQKGTVQPQTEGQWNCEAQMAGTTAPLKLQVEATVTGREVALGQRVVSSLEIPLHGVVDSEQIAISSEPFRLLGGLWQARGKHSLSQGLTDLDVTVDGLSVQAAAEMAGSPVKCKGSAKAQLQLAVPGFDLKQARAQGSWDVTRLEAPPLKAEQARGRLLVGNGTARFDQIELVQGSGKASGTMRFALDQPQRLFIEFATTEWPLQWPAQPVVVLLDSKAQVELDVLKKTIDGKGWLSSRVVHGDDVLAQVRASALASAKDQTLEVTELTGDVLGGKVEGGARVLFDKWASSTGEIHWQGVQPSRLGSWWPTARRCEGTLSGSLKTVEAAKKDRPPEPMKLEFDTAFTDGHVGPAQLGDCRAVIFVGDRRLMIDEAHLHLLGGQVTAWSSVSPHSDIVSVSVGGDFNDIDVNQLAYLTGGEQKRLVGRLSGRGTLLTTTDLRHLSGEAQLSISESDLVDNSVIRTLYDALRLDLGQARSQGSGQATILFEGSAISIPSLVYFNRGVEIRGAGQIKDFKRGKASPVEGYAVGSTRVLKNVRLPGISELDRLMASLQSGVASVMVGGTLGETEVKVVPLPALSGPLRNLLWAQLRKSE